MAERIADTGWVALERGSSGMIAEGRNGALYAVWPPGQSILLVPFVLAGRLVAAANLPVGGTPEMYGQFLACMLLFPACGALVLVLVYALVLDIGGDRRTARWIALAVGLATMHWHHSVSTGEEPLVALCLLSVLRAILRACRSEGWWYPLTAFALAGLGLWVRLTSAVVTGVMLAVGLSYDLAYRSDGRSRWQRFRLWLVCGALGLLPFVLAHGAYNSLRFGSVWETGYGPSARDNMGGGLFDTPLMVGLPAMLLSPGKGLFVYNPILLFAAIGVPLLCRSNRPLAAIIGLTFVASVLFHCRSTTWAGDLTWGTRYLASQIGIWALALVPILQRAKLRPAVLGLSAVSIVIQFASVFYSYALEFYQDRRHGLVPDYVWRPAESHLVMRFRNMALHALGRPIHGSIPPPVVRPGLLQVITSPDEVRLMHAVQFFPFKAYAHVRGRAVFVALLILWLLLIAALAGAATLWRAVCTLPSGVADLCAVPGNGRSPPAGS